MAFLVVLESLTPAQRVAFILHDVYGYPFAEVAEATGRTDVACRQLASAARRRVRAAQAAVVRAFRQAWEAQDIEVLAGLLDPDATAIADGGGRAVTFLDPIDGAGQIAQAWMEIARRRTAAMTLTERAVNGEPGLVAEQDGEIVTVFAFEVSDGRISRIWVVRNPEKLRSWTAG
jgi:RNA polymerase sigma-70 factor (ECF subfamily)